MGLITFNFDEQGGKSIEKGSTFNRKFSIQTLQGQFNFAGISARMVILSYNDSVILEMTTENDMISLLSNGIFELNIPSSITKDLQAGRYSYYLEFIYDETNISKKLFVGEIQITEQVTI